MCERLTRKSATFADNGTMLKRALRRNMGLDR